jgi:glycosyltransferase involved in cell wall biosynthesis
LKVSIITATYNSAATVKDTIKSVASQTYTHIEHIIIDGVSIDNTIGIIQEANPSVIIYQGKDKGIYDAMNKGIDKTTGDIIGILNSDDFYPSNQIIEKIVHLFKTSNCQCVYGDLWYVDAIDTKKITRKWKSGNYNIKNFLFGWMPPHPTFFVRKEVYEKYGKFNLNFWGAADYELILRFLYKHQLTVSYLPEVCVHMRSGGQSNVTLKNRWRANREDRKAWLVNNVQPYWFTVFLKPIRKIIQFI